MSVAGNVSKKAGYNRMRELGQAALKSLSARPIALSVILLASLAAAVPVSARFSNQTWQANATLLFTGASQGETGKEIVPSPDFKSVLSLLKTRSIFEDALAGQNLKLPAKALEANLSSNAPAGTRTIQLTLNWSDPDAATELLDDVIAGYSKVVADLRKQKATERKLDLERGLDDLSNRLVAARKALADFQTSNRVGDLQQELITVLDEIQGIEASLKELDSSRKSTETQLNLINKKLEDIRREDSQIDEDSRKALAAEESITDNRRRQDRLKELIGEQRRVMDLEGQIKIKKQDLDRLKYLLARNAVAVSTVQSAESELNSLQFQLKGNKSVQELEKEMEAIDKVVVPKSNKKNQGSPIIHQTLDKKLDRELMLAGYEQEIASQRERLTERRQRLQNLRDLQGQNTVLTGNIAALELQKTRTEEAVAACRQVEGMSAGDFSIVSPAMATSHPVKSNRKILMAGIGLGGLAFGIGALLFVELGRGFRGNEVAAWLLGMPVVSRIRQVTLVNQDEELSRIALMVRQQTHDHGALVTLVPSGETDADDPDLLVSLAREFADRDERVLALDLNALGSGPGLHEYLAYHAEAEEITNPVAPGVDLVHCGAGQVSQGKMSTRHMQELLRSWKEQYSLILVWGPSLDQTGRVVQIAAWSQMMLLVTASPSLRSSSLKTLHELAPLGGAPAGQIILA